MKKTGRSVRLLHSLFHHLDLLFCWWCIKPYIVEVQLKLDEALDELQGNLYIEHMEHRMHSWYM